MIKIRLIIQIMVIFLMIYEPCKHLKKKMQNYDVSSIYFCPCLTNILPEFVKDRSNKSFVEISNSVTVK